MTSETIVFLPWLHLKKAVSLYDLQFVPIGGEKGFSSLPDHLVSQAKLIATSYTDQAGHPIPDFTIVLRLSGSEQWNLSSEDFSKAREAASVLFFCSWALNDYYTQLGSYTNSSIFNVVGQHFSAQDPRGIALTLRRRDGETLSGGYNHGDVRFVCPPQYAINFQTRVDENLLSSLLEARNRSIRLFDLLISVLGLLELANTDRDYMSLSSEVILMSSAFETFFEIERGAKALILADAFEECFKAFSKHTVQDAISNGRPIFLDTKEGAASTWSILKGWCHEFYKLRNEFIHSKKSNRSWGWHELEHLVLSAFTFPLIVKLKLSDEGLYALSSEDELRCAAISDLLVTLGWGESEFPGSMQNTWRDLLYGRR